jgi:hypothetical protein
MESFMFRKFLALTVFLCGVLFSVTGQARTCDYRVSLTTASGWYYEGTGATYASAENNAITKCIRSGTIPRACREGDFQPLDRLCATVCTITTASGWIYTGSGQTEDSAINNAITKCIQDGTIPNACRNADVFCE